MGKFLTRGTIDLSNDKLKGEMGMKSSATGSKIFVTIMYVVMVAVNAMAVLLPLNGVTTQEVSDSYPNLFAPAGVTFSIWSVIYTLLLLFVIYQWLPPKPKSLLADPPIARKIRGVFILTSICNSLWIFAWQYFYVGLSVIIMLVFLVSLIYGSVLLARTKKTKLDYWLIRLPFSVYFGWITIATIADIIAFFVDKKLAFINDHQVGWTIAILIVGLAIIVFTTWFNLDIAYGITTIWGYAGILIKHQAATDGFNGKYPSIMTTVVVCLVVIAIACVVAAFRLRGQRTRSGSFLEN